MKTQIKFWVFCWRSGLIEFGTEVPEGSLPIASGPEKAVREAVSVAARHGWNKNGEPGPLLVPGVPEAQGRKAAVEAVKVFVGRVEERLNRGETA